CRLLAAVWLCACGPEAASTSTCYAPVPYAYRGEVRQLGSLPRGTDGALALPDGRVVVHVVELDEQWQPWSSFYRFDPSTGAREVIAERVDWIGPMTRLRDGRVFGFSRWAQCRYVLFEPDRPGSLVSRTCALESPDDGISVELIRQGPDGDVLLFGDFFRGGNHRTPTVFALDLGSGAIERLDTSAEHGFLRPPSAPFSLCDGRLVFPHTEVDGGDYYDDARAVHYYDPKTRQLSTLELPMAPIFAAQLDASTALLIGDEDDAPGAVLLDLETQTFTEVPGPPARMTGLYGNDALVGLADGTALAVADGGAIFIFDPKRGQFTESPARFADAPQVLVRLPAGPVVRIGNEGTVEIYE
ncbi:MAG TPA: hypothetical protein VIK91_24250, partial [Nannocystis sp.]